MLGFDLIGSGLVGGEPQQAAATTSGLGGTVSCSATTTASVSHGVGLKSTSTGSSAVVANVTRRGIQLIDGSAIGQASASGTLQRLNLLGSGTANGTSSVTVDLTRYFFAPVTIVGSSTVVAGFRGNSVVLIPGAPVGVAVVTARMTPRVRIGSGAADGTSTVVGQVIRPRLIQGHIDTSSTVAAQQSLHNMYGEIHDNTSIVNGQLRWDNSNLFSGSIAASSTVTWALRRAMPLHTNSNGTTAITALLGRYAPLSPNTINGYSSVSVAPNQPARLIFLQPEGRQERSFQIASDNFARTGPLADHAAFAVGAKSWVVGPVATAPTDPFGFTSPSELFLPPSLAASAVTPGPIDVLSTDDGASYQYGYRTGPSPTAPFLVPTTVGYLGYGALVDAGSQYYEVAADVVVGDGSFDFVWNYFEVQRHALDEYKQWLDYINSDPTYGLQASQNPQDFNSWVLTYRLHQTQRPVPDILELSARMVGISFEVPPGYPDTSISRVVRWNFKASPYINGDTWLNPSVQDFGATTGIELGAHPYTVGQTVRLAFTVSRERAELRLNGRPVWSLHLWPSLRREYETKFAEGSQWDQATAFGEAKTAETFMSNDVRVVTGNHYTGFVVNAPSDSTHKLKLTGFRLAEARDYDPALCGANVVARLRTNNDNHLIGEKVIGQSLTYSPGLNKPGAESGTYEQLILGDRPVAYWRDWSFTDQIRTPMACDGKMPIISGESEDFGQFDWWTANTFPEFWQRPSLIENNTDDGGMRDLFPVTWKSKLALQRFSFSAWVQNGHEAADASAFPALMGFAVPDDVTDTEIERSRNYEQIANIPFRVTFENVFGAHGDGTDSLLSGFPLYGRQTVSPVMYADSSDRHSGTPTGATSVSVTMGGYSGYFLGSPDSGSNWGGKFLHLRGGGPYGWYTRSFISEASYPGQADGGGGDARVILQTADNGFVHRWDMPLPPISRNEDTGDTDDVVFVDRGITQGYYGAVTGWPSATSTMTWGADDTPLHSIYGNMFNRWVKLRYFVKTTAAESRTQLSAKLSIVLRDSADPGRWSRFETTVTGNCNLYQEAVADFASAPVATGTSGAYDLFNPATSAVGTMDLTITSAAPLTNPGLAVIDVATDGWLPEITDVSGTDSVLPGAGDDPLTSKNPWAVAMRIDRTAKFDRNDRIAVVHIKSHQQVGELFADRYYQIPMPVVVGPSELHHWGVTYDSATGVRLYCDGRLSCEFTFNRSVPIAYGQASLLDDDTDAFLNPPGSYTYVDTDRVRVPPVVKPRAISLPHQGHLAFQDWVVDQAVDEAAIFDVVLNEAQFASHFDHGRARAGQLHSYVKSARSTVSNPLLKRDFHLWPAGVNCASAIAYDPQARFGGRPAGESAISGHAAFRITMWDYISGSTDGGDRHFNLSTGSFVRAVLNADGGFVVQSPAGESLVTSRGLRLRPEDFDDVRIDGSSHLTAVTIAFHPLAGQPAGVTSIREGQPPGGYSRGSSLVHVTKVLGAYSGDIFARANVRSPNLYFHYMAERGQIHGSTSFDNNLMFTPPYSAQSHGVALVSVGLLNRFRGVGFTVGIANGVTSLHSAIYDRVGRLHESPIGTVDMKWRPAGDLGDADLVVCTATAVGNAVVDHPRTLLVLGVVTLELDRAEDLFGNVELSASMRRVPGVLVGPDGSEPDEVIHKSATLFT